MARKKTKTAAEPSEEIKAREKFTRAKKCMKKTSKKVHEPEKHKSRKEQKAPSTCSDEPPSSQVQRSETTKEVADAQEVPVLDLHSGKEVRASGKMKLQLFPLDSRTRGGLEKDGFNPYLELTLSSRKKVSSVLQHIMSKWGISDIACGDPALYPYDQSVLTAGHKRIPNNNNITVGDVYAAIGAPSIFRLRYGWSSETDNEPSGLPSPSTLVKAYYQHEEPQNIISNKTESAGVTGKQIFNLDNPSTMLCSANQVIELPPSENISPDGQVDSVENKIKDGSVPTLFSWDDGLTNLSIGGLLSEVSMKGNSGNHCNNSKSGNANATLWEDNLTNISIGGLFSEASLQGRQDINRDHDPTHEKNNDQSGVSNGGLLSEASSQREGKFSETGKTITQQPLPLISDSLQAFLGNQTDQPQAPCPDPPRPEPSHSSILDAEDTCHAFAFRKRTTTSQKVLEQLSEEAEEEQREDESKPSKPLFGSTVFNQDSSLGFSKIKWADSRGPFDFGISLSRKFINK